MDESRVRAEIIGALKAIAPEVDAAALKPGELLRRQVDLDSYDWLNFLLELERRLSVRIAEADYAKLATVDQLVAYVRGRSSAS